MCAAHTIRVADAPFGFQRRPEFQPKSPLDGGRLWLPEDPFFGPGPLPRTAPEPSTRFSPSGRAALLQDVFARYSIKPSPRALENLRRVEDPRSRLVITGQQPGFLTGPLYTIYKAISAIAAARNLEARTGQPHVPVFWVASEDHDLDEARAASFPAPAGRSVTFSLPYEADRRPLSGYQLDDAGEATIEAALAHLAGRLHTDLARSLAELYRGRDLASGFAALLARLFADDGLLLVEPESLRRAATPLIRRCLEEPAEVTARIEEGIREVEAHGVSAQVGSRFPLFLLVGERRHHLAVAKGSGGSGGVRFAVEAEKREEIEARELLELLAEHPERFSTGVLLRPIVQEALLPASVVVGGPAEAAYFAQLKPLFRWFGVEPPPVTLRLSATLIEGKFARALRKLGLEGGEGSDLWENAYAPADFLAPVEGDPEPGLRALAQDVGGRLEGALADPHIAEAARRKLQSSAGKIVGELEALAARAGRAARESRSQELEAALKILHSFFPDGRLQERRWNILYYVAKYGSGWIKELIDATAEDPFSTRHRWVFFEESEGNGEE